MVLVKTVPIILGNKEKMESNVLQTSALQLKNYLLRGLVKIALYIRELLVIIWKYVSLIHVMQHLN